MFAEMQQKSSGTETLVILKHATGSGTAGVYTNTGISAEKARVLVLESLYNTAATSTRYAIASFQDGQMTILAAVNMYVRVNSNGIIEVAQSYSTTSSSYVYTIVGVN